MEQPTRFVGMDVHKDTIVVAVTATGDSGKATPYGTFPNTAAALEKLVERLRHGGRALDDPAQKRRPAEERQARRRQFGGLAPGRTADRCLGAGCGARGDARPDPRPSGGGAGGASRAPAVECVSAASRADLSGRPAGLDKGASRVAGRSELCSTGAADRAGREYRGGASGRTAAGSC